MGNTMTNLAELDKEHDKQAAAISIKTINAEGGCNPNDIVWLHHYPQLYRQYGRAKRVYLRLLEISNQ